MSDRISRETLLAALAERQATVVKLREAIQAAVTAMEYDPAADLPPAARSALAGLRNALK